MKNLVLALFLAFSCNLLSAQTFTAKESTPDKASTRSITLTLTKNADGTATYSRSYGTATAGMTSVLYNNANLQLDKATNSFIVPQGKTFWFIPFDPGAPIQVLAEPIKADCNHCMRTEGLNGESCAFSIEGSNTMVCKGCQQCSMTVSGYSNGGSGGVIVEAKSVTLK